MTTSLPHGHALRIFSSQAELMEDAADVLIADRDSVGAGFRLVLAGGSTPIGLYRVLAARSDRIKNPWSAARFTFGDERSVPPGHSDSNYSMAKRELLDPLGVPETSILRLRGEDAATTAAEKAHKALLEWSQRVPLFDVVLLGVGEDGHVASLFPSDSWPGFGVRLAAATRHPGGQDRVTLTPGALASTRHTLFLVSGKAKARAVRQAMEAPQPTPQYPSRMVVAVDGRATWFLDAEAASEVPEEWWDGAASKE